MKQAAKGNVPLLPSIRSLHPYLPPPPSIPTMPQANPNPNHNGSDHDDCGDYEEPPKKRRRRQALSCTECKRRKIRCDRNQPCTPCMRRGDHAKCRWAVVEQVTERFAPLAEHEALRARVGALESFVSHLPPAILASMPPVPAASSATAGPSTARPSFFATSPPHTFQHDVHREGDNGEIVPLSPRSPHGEDGRRPSAIWLSHASGSDSSSRDLPHHVRQRSPPRASHAEQRPQGATSPGPLGMARRYTYPHARGPGGGGLHLNLDSPPRTGHGHAMSPHSPPRLIPPPSPPQRRRRSASRSRSLAFPSPSPTSEWAPPAFGAFSPVVPPFSSSYSSSRTSFTSSPPPLSLSSSASGSSSDAGRTSGESNGSGMVGRSSFRTNQASTEVFGLESHAGLPSTSSPRPFTFIAPASVTISRVARRQGLDVQEPDILPDAQGNVMALVPTPPPTFLPGMLSTTKSIPRAMPLERIVHPPLPPVLCRPPRPRDLSVAWLLLSRRRRALVGRRWSRVYAHCKPKRKRDGHGHGRDVRRRC